MTEFYNVVLNKQIIGVVKYETASDIQGAEIYLSRMGAANGDRPIGELNCLRHPSMENPHELRWVDLERNWIDPDKHPPEMPGRILYCPTCVCLVTWPHDGYAYDEYPAEWLALVKEDHASP